MINLGHEGSRCVPMMWRAICAGPYRGVDGEECHEQAHNRPPRRRRGEHGGAGTDVCRRSLIGIDCAATLARDERGGGGDSGEGGGEQKRREPERQSQAGEEGFRTDAGAALQQTIGG